MQKCNELNIYIMNTTYKTKIKLKEEMANVNHFSLEGNNIYLDNIPMNLNNLKSLKLISKVDNSNSPYYSDNYEKENICINISQDFYQNLYNIQELTLKYLSLEQFLSLVNYLNNKKDESKNIKIKYRS